MMRRRTFVRAALAGAAALVTNNPEESPMTINAAHAAGRNGSELDDRATRELAAALRGELILPANNQYDTARAVWNGAIDRRPAMIVRAAGADDAVAAVRFALEQDVPFAVRGAGHNVAGYPVVDGGVLLDLSHLNG